MFDHEPCGTRWWDTQYKKQMEFLKEIGVSDRSDGQRILHALKYRFKIYISPIPLKEIPICGFLIPSHVFEETYE